MDALVEALIPAVENGVELSPWIRGIEADGSLVGLLVLSEATAAHRWPVLRYLVVDRWSQRRGIGRRALEEAAEHVRSDGQRVLRARWVDAKGGPGKFLERVGFVGTSTDGSQVEGELRL